jgi:hypothetical protein
MNVVTRSRLASHRQCWYSIKSAASDGKCCDMQRAVAVKQQLNSGRAVKVRLRVIELTIVVVEVEMPLTKGNILQLLYPSSWIEIPKVNMVCQGCSFPP